MVDTTEQHPEQHLRHSKDDRDLHLERVCEGDFVETTLPNLKV